MKSLLIVSALCALFLVVSGKDPLPRDAGLSALVRPEACAVQEKKQGPAPEARKPVAAKLPRWHRLIPGMFR